MPPIVTNDEEANASDQQENGEEQQNDEATVDTTPTAASSVDLSANDPTSIANANHLDHLESSEAVTDIASFQDIDLPPPTINAQDIENANTTTAANGNGPNTNNNNGPRRAKKFYYCLPMIQMYKFTVMACLLVFFLLFLAIGLSASSMKSQNENINSSQMENVGEDDRGEMIFSDAPPSTLDWDVDGDAHVDGSDYGEGYDEQGPSFPLSMDTDGDGNVDTNLNEDGNGWNEEDGDGDEELGDPLEVDVPEFGTQPPRESTSSTTLSTDKPTPSSTTSATEAPTDPHPLNPQWFQTTHEDYQNYLALHTNLNTITHPYDTAGLFCHSQNLTLCSYADYCPNGQASEGFKGGPPTAEEHSWNTLEETQWAPFYTGEPSNGKEEHWVQVGVIPDSDGGDVDNGYGGCYTFNSWWNLGVVSFEEVVDVENRRWMLCCEKDVERY